MLLPVAYIFVFMYIPMYGTQIAFREFLAIKGIWGSDWVGFKYFQKFFDSPYFVRRGVQHAGNQPVHPDRRVPVPDPAAPSS